MTGAVIFVIDPVADFVVPGLCFDVAYGSESILPLQKVVERIKLAITKHQGENTKWVLVSSIYTHNQFKHPKLKNLCVTEEGQKSIIDVSLFDYHVIKTGNSFLQQSEKSPHSLDQIIAENSHFIITGLTVQSCVKQSTEGLVEYINKNNLNEKQVFVVRNLVAGRAEGKKREQSIIDAWEANSIINVFDSWSNVKETLQII